ncbi:MAG: hypothetical protein NT166_04885 [Candidatus Aminicenantes bacterium]|nr:hypothetical protein [Candidatus Aminicenantes bacterium]
MTCDRMTDEGMLGYLPGGVNQSLVIEVYLPKNILNYGALIKLLTETIEFDRAHKWLLDNWDEFYNKDIQLFKLDQNCKSYLINGEVLSELKEQFLHNGYPLSNYTELKEDGNICWLRIDNFNTYYINNKTLVVYKPSVWKANMGFIWEKEYFGVSPLSCPRSKPPISLTEIFRKQLKEMEKTIIGYSIYEVDGAFEDNKKGNNVPSRLFSLEKKIINDLKKNSTSKIRETFNKEGYPLREYLFRLNQAYKIDLKGRDVNDRLKKAFEKENQNLSDHTEIKLIDCNGEQYYSIIDYGEERDLEREYAIYNVDEEYRVYRIDVKISQPERATERWELSVGNTIYDIKKEFDKHEKADKSKKTKLNVYKRIRIVEERTLVIRFLTNLEIRSGFPSILSGGRIDSKEKVDERALRNAYKKLWDTMTLIGQYFVYNLGSEVNIEDQIWISCNVGYLWIWENGEIKYK